MAVKAFGADAVAIADIKRDNLDLAMKLGADVALNPDRDAAPQEVATWMRAALPPHGPDMVIDCAGFEPTLQVSPAHPCFLQEQTRRVACVCARSAPQRFVPDKAHAISCACW